MSWLEFIAQMSNAWAWPAVAGGTILLLRKQIKSAATSLVGRVGDIRRLKAAGVDVEFDEKVRELAEAAKELRDAAPDALPTAQLENVILPPETAEQRSLKYQRLAQLEPRAAVLSSFADLETFVRQKFQQLYPDASPNLSFRAMVDTLRRDGHINDGSAAVLTNMGALRNEAAQEPSTQIDPTGAQVFVDTVEGAYLMLDSAFLLALNKKSSSPSPE